MVFISHDDGSRLAEINRMSRSPAFDIRSQHTDSISLEGLNGLGHVFSLQTGNFRMAPAEILTVSSLMRAMLRGYNQGINTHHMGRSGNGSKIADIRNTLKTMKKAAFPVGISAESHPPDGGMEWD